MDFGVIKAILFYIGIVLISVAFAFSRPSAKDTERLHYSQIVKSMQSRGVEESKIQGARIYLDHAEVYYEHNGTQEIWVCLKKVDVYVC